MAKFGFETEICSITDEKIRNILTYFHEKLIEKDDQIVSLTNQVTELESRVIQLERYSSKVTIIINNPPLQPGNANITDQILFFFNKCLNYSMTPDAIKACHPLGNWKGNSPLQ